MLSGYAIPDSKVQSSLVLTSEISSNFSCIKILIHGASVANPDKMLQKREKIKLFLHEIIIAPEILID